MATVADGTYVIVSALDTSKAVDCKGASEVSGANVQIWTRSDGDSQLIHITTNSNGSRMLRFAMSQKCMDIQNGVYKNGTNVQQFSNHKSLAQDWVFTDTNETATINGTTYSLFTIKSYANQTFVLDAAGGTAKIGTNVQIYTSNASTAQKWILIPQNPIPTGMYIIRSALDTKAVLDVAGGSSANGANVQLYGANGSNAQIWLIAPYGSTGLTNIINYGSGKYLNISNGTIKNNQNVNQYAKNGSDAQKWGIEPEGTSKFNGETVGTYRIHAYSGSNYVLDAAGGKTAPKTNIEIYQSNSSKAQEWYFQPYSIYVTNLGTPADILVNGQTQVSDVSVAYPSWICSGTNYQCRYRTRRRPLDGSLADWSDWCSLKDGDESNYGWGDVGKANAVVGDTARKLSTLGVTVPEIDNYDYDYAEIQFQVRRHENNYNKVVGLCAHGDSCTRTIGFSKRPTLVITSAVWSPIGLSIGYDSSYKVDGNSITVNSIVHDGVTICGETYFGGQPSSGVLDIPISDLYLVPGDSISVDVSLTLITKTNSSVTKTSTLTVTYESDNTLEISPEYQFNSYDYTYTANVQKHDSDKCYIRIPTLENIYGYKLIECKETATTDSIRQFLIIPPLNTEYEVCWICKSGTIWNTLTEKKSKVECYWTIWNWDDSVGAESTILKCNVDEPPKQTDTSSPENSKFLTTNREYGIFSYEGTRSQTLDVSGSILDDEEDSNADIKAFQYFKQAKHAVYRKSNGAWYNVAITSVSIDHEKAGYYPVTVNQEAETL